MSVRQKEDRDALQALQASPVHLPFLAAGYGVSSAIEEITEALAQQLDARSLETVLFPLGIYHADHVATQKAACSLIRARPHIRWCLYEELPYRYEHPNLGEEQKRALQNEALGLSPLALPHDPSKLTKLRMIRCYRSQVRGLGWNRIRKALRDERYWQVSAQSEAKVG